MIVASLMGLPYRRRKPNIPEEVVTSVEKAMDKTVAELFQSDEFSWLLTRIRSQETAVRDLYNTILRYGYDLTSRVQYGHRIDFDCIGMKVHRRMLEGCISEYAGESADAAKSYFELIHARLIKNLPPIEEIWQQHNLATLKDSPRSR